MERNNGYFLVEVIISAIIVGISIISIAICFSCGVKTMERHNNRNEALQLACLELMRISNNSFIERKIQKQDGVFTIKSGSTLVKREIVYRQINVDVYLKDEKEPIVNMVMYE